MIETEEKNSKTTIKCPNPECGLVLNSPYHTVCPLCAEPFPIDMLYVEKQTNQTYKLIILIMLIVVIIAFAAFMIWFYN